MIRAAHRLDGAVLQMVLDQPKGNVLDAAMIAAISGTLQREVRPRTRLLVFEGAGENFCYGASIEEHQAEQAAAMLATFHGLFRQLAELAIPSCAVVRGQCLGGGLELAAWCTWIVATPDARLGQPEIQLAVFPPMASVLLPWRVGGQLAMDLCISGKVLAAEEAHCLGLINAVEENPEAWWTALVENRLAKTSASSLRFAERAVRVQLMGQLSQGLPALERLYLDELMKTHDANEGVAAFLERRRPNYSDS